MPHRKLVQIGASPKLPTIAEFFQEMAHNQKDEIAKLKREVLSAGERRDPLAPTEGKPSRKEKVSPYPFLLHPVKKAKPQRAKRKK